MNKPKQSLLQLGTKHWPIAVLIALVAVIFFCFLFLFQIQQNEYALVLRLGHPQLDRDTSPGLRWRLPYPIEEVWRHDNRIYTFPTTSTDNPTKGELEEVYTADKINIVVTVYLTWRIWADETMSLRQRNENILRYMQQVGKASVAEKRLNE
ncbi:MAG: hypothetical protein D6820_03175, partial [Lentisphaerae bacterium]